MTISHFLESKLRAALDGAEARVTIATDARFGDYQTNAAMILAKQQCANPRQLAQQIIDRLDVAEMCEPPEIAGAGFINFRLKPDWLAQQFAALVGDERHGVPAPATPRKIVIDFSSPNVAKPMHVGHIRSTILGDALARIAAFLGHEIVRDNHIGDWGTQFGMLLVGWKSELNNDALATDPLGEMERIYKLVSARCREDAATLDRARQELVKLQSGDIFVQQLLPQHNNDEAFGRRSARVPTGIQLIKTRYILLRSDVERVPKGLSEILVWRMRHAFRMAEYPKCILNFPD